MYSNDLLLSVLEWRNYIFGQVVFLDDSSQNLKPAREMGMTTILVKNPITALKDLQKVTGVDVSSIQLEWFLPSLSHWIRAFRAVTSNRQTEAVWPSVIIFITVVKIMHLDFFLLLFSDFQAVCCWTMFSPWCSSLLCPS